MEWDAVRVITDTEDVVVGGRATMDDDCANDPSVMTELRRRGEGAISRLGLGDSLAGDAGVGERAGSALHLDLTCPSISGLCRRCGGDGCGFCCGGGVDGVGGVNGCCEGGGGGGGGDDICCCC